MNPSTYLIDRKTIEKVFSMKDYVSTVEDVFKEYGKGNVHMPPKVYLDFNKGDLRCMPTYIPSMNIAGVKNVNVHPNNKNLPSVMATITLINPETGFPLAIMDGTHITNMRTGAAGGVAAKYLAKEDTKIVAFIGAGVQAKTQLEALLVAKPKIQNVRIYDPSSERSVEFGMHILDNYDCFMGYEGSVEDAVANADIIVTTTPVRKPIVKEDYVSKGVHINAIGADAEGKQELDVGILKKADIVIDNWEQASHSGEINFAVSQRIITQEDIYANIGEIVTGKKPGRKSLDQITIFDSTGLAIQDISCANEIYRRLMEDKKSRQKLQMIEFF